MTLGLFIISILSMTVLLVRLVDLLPPLRYEPDEVDNKPTKLSALIDEYMGRDNLDPTSTLDFLLQADKLSDPFAEPEVTKPLFTANALIKDLYRNDLYGRPISLPAKRVRESNKPERFDDDVIEADAKRKFANTVCETCGLMIMGIGTPEAVLKARARHYNHSSF